MSHHQVLGLLVAGVEVVVVLGHQVHVVEDEAVPGEVLQGLQVAHVQQLGSVERCITGLEKQNKNQVDEDVDRSNATRFLSLC